MVASSRARTARCSSTPTRSSPPRENTGTTRRAGFGVWRAGLLPDSYLNSAETIGLHAEWNLFKEVGDFGKTGHDSDISFFSVGVLLHTP